MDWVWIFCGNLDGGWDVEINGSWIIGYLRPKKL